MVLSAKILPFVLTTGLLAGAGIDMLSRPGRRHAEPFHRRVREAALNVPLQIGDWTGTDHQVAVAVTKLLRPNVIIERRYENKKLGLSVGFLLVQCKDARDMGGHYPPVCYPGSGYELEEARDDTWIIAGKDGQRPLPVREYYFVKSRGAMIDEIYVANLVIMPDGRILRDVSAVRAAEADRARRFFGAAQIQLVFSASIPQEQRRAIFSEILGANTEMLDALCSGGK